MKGGSSGIKLMLRRRFFLALAPSTPAAATCHLGRSRHCREGATQAGRGRQAHARRGERRGRRDRHRGRRGRRARRSAGPQTLGGDHPSGRGRGDGGSLPLERCVALEGAPQHLEEGEEDGAVDAVAQRARPDAVEESRGAALCASGSWSGRERVKSPSCMSAGQAQIMDKPKHRIRPSRRSVRQSLQGITTTWA